MKIASEVIENTLVNLSRTQSADSNSIANLVATRIH